MVSRLDVERLRTIEEVRDFMAGSEPVDVHLTERRGACDFVRRTLVRPACGGLTKAHKGGRASRCGEGHGIDQGADDAADRPAPQDRAHRGPSPRGDAPVRAALPRGRGSGDSTRVASRTRNATTAGGRLDEQAGRRRHSLLVTPAGGLPMGRIVVQTRITNLSGEGRSIRCGMLVDTGAGALILPMRWKERLGDFQRSEAVELQLANGGRRARRSLLAGGNTDPGVSSGVQ